VADWLSSPWPAAAFAFEGSRGGGQMFVSAGFRIGRYRL